MIKIEGFWVFVLPGRLIKNSFYLKLDMLNICVTFSIITTDRIEIVYIPSKVLKGKDKMRKQKKMIKEIKKE